MRIPKEAEITAIKWIISGSEDVIKRIPIKRLKESSILELWDDRCDPSLMVEVDVETQSMGPLDSFTVLSSDHVKQTPFLNSAFQFIASSDVVLASIPITKLQELEKNNTHYYNAIMNSSSVLDIDTSFLPKLYLMSENFEKFGTFNN
jgi:hypothetical protein